MTNQEKNILWWSVIGAIALFIVMVGMAKAQTFDGPAELPRTTPAVVAVSLNNPIVVPAGENLQAVINSAICGDTIQYDPVGIWTTSSFVQPSISTCDNQHWITIDGKGGKIVLAGSSASIKGGIFVRLANFVITRIGGTGVMYNMITPGPGAHDIIYDSLDVEGTTTDETVRAFELSNVPNVTIINTKVREMHCLANGACTDSQAVNFGLDKINQGGNYLFDHDDFEAAGENILGGGDAANFVPCDITITNTRLAKPYSWNPNEPTFAGKQWIVKNLFELKNGCRVLFANNKLDGSWGGYTQTGFAILLTPKNPANTCPNCVVTDVTLRNFTSIKTAQAFQIGCGPSDTGGWPADCGRYSIHDFSFSQLQYPTCYKCGGFITQISSAFGPAGSPVLHDVTVNLGTFDLDAWYKPTGCPSCGHGFLLIGGPPTGMLNIQFTNNVTFSGNYPIYSTGGGAAVNCAISGTSDYVSLINACWTGKSAFIGNVILSTGAPGRVGLANWPSGNHVVTAGQNVNGN
jgi:hypothetical protein